MLDRLKHIFFKKDIGILIQFFRYAIVGGMATVVDVSVFSVLSILFGINYLISNTASFVCGLIINYLLSKFWVFNSKKGKFRTDFLVFALTGVIGLGISSFVLYVLLDLRLLYGVLFFSSKDMVKIIAKLTATIVTLFWNFISRKKFIFSNDRKVLNKPHTSGL